MVPQLSNYIRCVTDFIFLLFTVFLIGVLKRIRIVFLEDNADSLEDSSSLDWGSVMSGLSLTFGLTPSENLKPSGFLAFEKK